MNEREPRQEAEEQYENIFHYPTRAGITLLASLVVKGEDAVVRALAAAKKYREMVDALDEHVEAEEGESDSPPPCFDCPARTIYYCQESGAACREFRFYVEHGHCDVPDNRVYSQGQRSRKKGGSA